MKEKQESPRGSQIKKGRGMERREDGSRGIFRMEADLDSKKTTRRSIE